MLYTNRTGSPVGRITNIQKYTIHDGPGIRTELFFKGCPLSCLWCSNPETQRFDKELGLYPAKCIGSDKCGWCVRACPAGGTPLRFDAEHKIFRIASAEACAGCSACADACPGHAIKLWGEEYTVDELMKIILEDRSYYLKTGGGVTLNGGEVLLQWEFARQLLGACSAQRIHTCVETALHVPRSHVDAILPCTDLIITDIKHMDTQWHEKHVGCGNERILDNIRHIAEAGKKLIIRTPVIPGYNDDRESIRMIGAFIRDQLGNRIVQYQLLPYRRMGTEKYASLCRPYPLDHYAVPERSVWEKNLLDLQEILVSEYNVPAVAGSAQKLKL